MPGSSAGRPFVGVTVRNLVRGAVVVLAVALVGAGCAAPSETGGAAEVTVAGGSGPYRGTELDGRYRLPSTELKDTQGRPFDLAEDTRRPVTLVFFGYTSCPDVCNIVLANMASALRRAGQVARHEVDMVFVTSDPQRDTPPVIREYLDRFDPSFVGLTARMRTIRKTADTLGVALTGKVDHGSEQASGYEVGHGTQVVAYGRDDRSILVWTADTAVADLRADIRELTQRATG
ncbi:MAG: SCO family protein [Actinomycetes bacterium]